MATISTTSAFGTSIPDSYFKKEILKFGEYHLLYRQFANKESIPKGNGKVWKANRYLRLPLPLSALSEGVTPSDTDMTIEQVNCTASQYGIVVTVSDVLEMTVDHPVLQQAISLVRDVMERLDNEIICEALLAGANVIYPGVVTTRVGLAATDKMSTLAIQKAVAQLEFPSDTWASAPRFEGGSYKCILHRKHELDLVNDATWQSMAIRLSKEDLDKGVVNRWMGVEFYTTNFGPRFENLGTTNAGASPTAVNAGIADSATAVSSNGAFATANYDFTWTRRHLHRRFEEGISGVITVAMTATHSAKFYAPTNTAYAYTLYAGTSGGTRFKTAANNVAASSITDGLGVAAAGTVAPANPNTAVNVYVSFFMGKGAYAVVDLDSMEAGIDDSGRTDSDPLKQRRKIGAKFLEGALILSDNNLVRVEAASTF